MKITVNASELRTVFRDVKPIFKNSQDGALMNFCIENHILYITCTNGLVYEQQIPSEHAGPYSLTVLHQDLSELLPGRGVVELELAPLYVAVTCDSFTATLPQANGVSPRYVSRCTGHRQIDPAMFKRWAKAFGETMPVAKSLQREVAVIFKPPYAIMKYPTFWLQLPNESLNAVMSLSELKAVAGFGPTSVCQGDGVLEFQRGSATLALPRTTAGDCKFVTDLTASHGVPRTVAGSSQLSRVQQFLRSVGVGECRCILYQNGMQLTAGRNTLSSTLRLGEQGTQVAAFTTFLEYVQMLLKLLDEQPYEVSVGEGSVCVRTSNLSALLSVT